MTRLVSRRQILKCSGVTLALPLLEGLQPDQKVRADSTADVTKRRMVAINIGLGLHGPNIIPETSGPDYELSPYLKVLEAYRNQFTFISGASHPSVGGGHQSAKSFLTAAPHPGSAGFRNSISMDQLAAEQLGSQTRFASLSLTSSGPGLSWSRSGVEVPAESRPSAVFKKLFLSGKQSEQAAQVQRLRDGQSVLDIVAQQADAMQGRMSGRDRQKMEEYFSAVREAEKRLVKAEQWEEKPKPKPDIAEPKDESDRTKITERLEAMFDMMHLALETDSTRFITFFETGFNAVPTIPGVDTDYHMLSHHGKDPAKISQLTIVETELMKVFGRFLQKLDQSHQAGSTLLDQTMVLLGSNLGNASSHDTRNMPMLLAGGGFKHGQHLAFDRDNNHPLPQLYVSMLQRLGIETDTFATTTGTLPGLELI
jgi:hypothetical protein